MSILPLHEQLIVAADFIPPKARDETYPGDEQWVSDKVLSLADALSDTRVTIKLNSALRLCGYQLIDSLHARGLSVMVDLKFNDVSSTLAADGALLAPYKPKLVTVMCSTGLASMQAIVTALPDSKVLGVTVLTTHDEDETRALYERSIAVMVRKFANRGMEATLGGFVCSPRELAQLRQRVPESVLLVTPGVRPDWASIPGDDQNPTRVLTPAEAIKRGADALVVGRPITRAPNPRDAVLRTLDEIHSVQ